MKSIKEKFFFYFTLLFFHSIITYSQSDNGKETPSLFILQGTVKVNNKPTGGVSLVLEKNGRQIAKNTTPKNGIYYFQLAKSNSDVNSEYLINVVKSGVAEGVLLVNTYIPKEEFSPVPYVFNLEFSLTGVTGASSVEQRNFGKIRWFSEKKAFDFDKEYAVAVEKEKQHKKELEREKAIADSLKIEKEKDELAKKIEQQKQDSIIAEQKLHTIQQQTEDIAALTTDKNGKHSEANTLTNKSNTNKNKTGNDSNNHSENNIASSSEKSIAEAKSNVINSKNKTGNQKNNIQSTDLTNSETTVTNNANILAHKTNEQANNKNADHHSAENNVADGSSEGKKKLAGGTNGENINSLQQKTNSSGNFSSTATSKNNSTSSSTNARIVEQKNLSGNSNSATNSGTENLNANNSSTTFYQKDLFFLTGIPMGQFKKNIADNVDTKNYFDTENVVDLTNERNRLLNEKARMARKKAENLAKKHETNNTLTSLLNIVDEYEKR